MHVDQDTHVTRRTLSELERDLGEGKLIRIHRSMESGAPDWIRTSDLQLRRLPLYPSELRAREGAEFTEVLPRAPIAVTGQWGGL